MPWGSGPRAVGVRPPTCCRGRLCPEKRSSKITGPSNVDEANRVVVTAIELLKDCRCTQSSVIFYPTVIGLFCYL